MGFASDASDASDANVTIIAGEFDLSDWHLTNSRSNSNSKRKYIWDSSVIPDASDASDANVTIEITKQTTSDHDPPE
jgi:hypothetical protein